MAMCNLPPGCTPKDIDRAAGELGHCKGCGKEFYLDRLDEDGYCKRCRNADDEYDKRRDDRNERDSNVKVP